jgi:hypothetical protein
LSLPIKSEKNHASFEIYPFLFVHVQWYRVGP